MKILMESCCFQNLALANEKPGLWSRLLPCIGSPTMAWSYEESAVLGVLLLESCRPVLCGHGRWVVQEGAQVKSWVVCNDKSAA